MTHLVKIDPEKQQVVPKEPCALQTAKGIGAICRGTDTLNQAEGAYKAMLSAAPPVEPVQMPTREEIALTITGARFGEEAAKRIKLLQGFVWDSALEEADAILALLNGRAG